MTILKNTLISKVRKAFSPRDAYLKRVTGVIHVGANAGQERELYASFHLDVVWIEPIPRSSSN